MKIQTFSRIIEKRALLFLGIAIALYCAIFITLSCLRHYAFQTQLWDMGAFDQSFWFSTQGRLMHNTLEDAPNHLGVHMSPLLILLVPGYILFPSPYYLLVMQTLALALAAWPLFLIARKQLTSSGWALGLAIGYLLYPTAHWVNLFDFHEEPFFIAAFFAAWYATMRKKWIAASIFFIIAATAKENAALLVIVAMIYITIIELRNHTGKKAWLVPATLALLVAIYFIVNAKLIMPELGGGLLRLDRYRELGSTPIGILQGILTKPGLALSLVFAPQKMVYLFWILLPVAFLPFASVTGIVLLAVPLLQNMLTTYSFQFAQFYHYDAILLPGIWIGTTYAVAFLRARFKWRRFTGYTLVLTIITAFLLNSPINPFSFPVALFSKSPNWTAYRYMVSRVPDRVSVVAPTYLVPHLTHREYINMLGHETFTPDIILADTQDTFGFDTPDAFKKYLDAYTQSKNYAITVIDDRYLIMTRKGVELKPESKQKTEVVQ